MDTQVKVFVSSAFMGMRDERNILATEVFPEIRKLCKERKLIFTEIDLRFGVAKEDQASFTVSTCLKRVAESGYFLGLLGERYGTELRPEQIDACSEFPWVKNYQDRSATELEILRALLDMNSGQVLANTVDKSLFYFRNPDYKDFVPKKDQEQYSDNLENRNKQDVLKQQIRDWNCKVTEYNKPVDLKELVIEQLWALIEQDFPEQEFSRHQLEEFEDNFAEDLQTVYIRREADFAKLTDYVKTDNLRLAVVGEGGIGKSALLANWGAEYRQAGNYLFWNFCGCSEASTNPIVIIQRLHESLQQHYQFNLEDKIPYSTEIMTQKLEQLIKQDDKPVVVIIDGLNQLDERQATVDWLLDLIPASVRLLVSSTESLPDFEVIEILPLQDAEKRELVTEYFKLYGKNLDDYLDIFCGTKQLDIFCDAHQTDNPLFLKIILEESRLYNESYKKFGDKLESYYLAAHTLPELYTKVLNRLEQDFRVRGKFDKPTLSWWQKLVGTKQEKGANYDFLVEDAVGLLAVSKFGINESELLDLLQVPQSVWSPLYLSLPLVNRSGLLSFANDYFQQAVEKRYNLEELRAKLVDYFAEQTEDARVVDELVFHLIEIGDTERLLQYISKIPVLMQFMKDKRQYELLDYWHRLGKQNSEVAEIYLQELVEYEKTGLYDNLGFILDRVASFCRDMGIYTEEVTALAYRFLEITKKVFGLQHNSTATALNNLATLLDNKEDYEQAESLHRQALEIRENILGSEHPDTATLLNNLAHLLREKEDYEQAEPLFRQALEIRKSILGYEHPDTADSLNGLGKLLNKKGDYEQAEPLIRQALEIREETLGSQHPDTADSLKTLANLLENTGDYKQAEKLYQQALEVAETALSSEHPDTIKIREDLNNLPAKIFDGA